MFRASLPDGLRHATGTIGKVSSVDVENFQCLRFSKSAAAGLQVSLRLLFDRLFNATQCRFVWISSATIKCAAAAIPRRFLKTQRIKLARQRPVLIVGMEHRLYRAHTRYAVTKQSLGIPVQNLMQQVARVVGVSVNRKPKFIRL